MLPQACQGKRSAQGSPTLLALTDEDLDLGPAAGHGV